MTSATAAEGIHPGTVQVEVARSVATVTFSHPKGNSLPAPLLRELAETFDRLATTADSRVIVLGSKGSGTFCAGASFDELCAIRNEVEGKEFFSGFARLILAMRRCPKLILGRIHGKAVGGGVGVAAATDYAFALTAASARLSELAVGIGPFVVGPVIERRIGRSAFAAMAIDTDWRDAAWCERHGLYTRVLDTEAALDSVLPAMAHRLAGMNPDAMAQLKRVIWEGTQHWDTLLPERAALSGRLVLSEHARRAIEAFKQQGTSGEVRAARLP
jgi:methylglutaconyl-CoA hydratase